MGEEDRGSLPARIYEDAAAPTVQVFGQALAGVARAALARLNIRTWSIERAADYAREDAIERLERRRVPSENRIAPPPELALGVIQSLQFPDNDPTLREMYLNLLATSMDDRYPTRTHPAFVDVLRQLSPLEARVIGGLRKQLDTEIEDARAIPLLGIRVWPAGEPSVYKTHLKHAAAIPTLPGEDIPRQAIENLDRLSVIDVQGAEHLADKGRYAPAKQRPDVIRVYSECMEREGSVGYNYYMAEITDFGYELILAVTEPV